MLPALESMLKDDKILAAAPVVITVQMSDGELITELAKTAHAEFTRISPYAEYKAISDLDESDLRKYFCTLLWMRVCQVMSPQDKAFAGYKSLCRSVRTDVILYQVLAEIGVAYDKDYGLIFNPAYSIPRENLLSPSQMQEISNLYIMFEDRGVKSIKGIPLSPDGGLAFMACSHVTSEVVSYRKDHPVYGFLASFVAQQELSTVTGQMSRIIYGYESDYKLRLRALWYAINRTV